MFRGKGLVYTVDHTFEHRTLIYFNVYLQLHFENKSDCTMKRHSRSNLSADH